MKIREKCYNDKEYIEIIKDILENEEFKKMESFIQHKKNRVDHLLRVSYHSYKIIKKWKKDYKSTARAALLHDFYYADSKSMTSKERLKMLFKHPKIALENSRKITDVNRLEEDIILSHMFPIGLRFPRHIESWIVNIVDDISSVYEAISRKK